MAVHLVFITKYRHRVLDRDAVDRPRLLFRKVSTDFESPLTEMDGEDTHVYRVVRYPPKVAISKLVNSLKGVSSRMLRQERPDLARRYSERRAVVAFQFRRPLWRCPPQHAQVITSSRRSRAEF